nr:hypothetical protein [Deltaproteobacteria bacterium]
ARRPAFELPTWAVQIGPLVAGAPIPDAPEHAGEVRYVVEPPDPAGRLVIRPEVVRWSADGTRPLKSIPYPGSREKLRSLVPVDDADLAFHDAWAAADEVRRRLKTPPERALSAALLEPLSRSARVTFEGRSVTVETAPLAPRLHAALAEGALQLAWEPPLAVVWSQGFALTATGALHRLSERIPAAIRQRLADSLPVVPPEDVEMFVEKWAARLDVALPPELMVEPRPDAREARLVLSEDGSTLHVRLELVQLRNGREERGLLRDPGWEDAERERFRAEVGFQSLPMAEAAEWLRDVLPGLRARWIVYGEDGLVGIRVRGTLSPSVSFRGGEDGFTLDATFAVEGRDVPPIPVLESWLRGLKYHRLDDGTIAALPEAWLARHGRVLDALVRTRRLGSWHAWEASEITGGDPVEWVAAYRAGVPDLAPPDTLRATLRPYQRAGQSWLRFLASHGLHGVLADDMGLGKTLQALAAILAVPGPALIVAPTSVLGVWMDEIRRYTPLRAILYHGADREPWGPAAVVVPTYGLLRRDTALRARRWTWAVLDEAQAIKQPGSKVARAARELRAIHRLALTGTPVENDLTELWSLFAFLQPGYLGSRRSVHGRTAGPARRDTDSPVLAELRQTIRPFVLRRRKAEVAPELPSRTVVVQPVALSPAERGLYESIRATYREADGKLHLLEVLTRLRQACCHPALLPFPEAREVPRSSKLRALMQRVREAVAGGHRMLVFSQWPTLLH